MKKEILHMILSIVPAYIFSLIVIFIVAKIRGYQAFGGEFLLLLVLPVANYFVIEPFMHYEDDEEDM